MSEEALDTEGVNWTVNIKPQTAGRVDGTIQSHNAKFLVLIHDLPDKPYVSVSTDGGESFTPIPNGKAWPVFSRPFMRWRIEGPGEGLWVLIQVDEGPGG
jgi:hypothetical protein